MQSCWDDTIQELLQGSLDWTSLHTALAMGTSSVTNRFNIRKRRNDREKGPQRTEVATPEPLSEHSNVKEEDEKEKDQKIDLGTEAWEWSTWQERCLGRKVLNLGKEVIENERTEDKRQ